LLRGGVWLCVGDAVLRHQRFIYSPQPNPNN
jgi:hypothetical protein